MPATDWIQARIAFVRALKSPTASQSLLLQLADLPVRGRAEQRDFDTLVKLEKINERAEKARAKAYKVVAQKRDEARRERNHRLIVQGALVDLAGLADIDRGVLMGGLIELAERFAGADGIKFQFICKARGDALLAERDKSAASSKGEGRS